MFDWVPFAFGAAILVWAAASAAHAFSGGQHAGHHEIFPPQQSPEPEERRMAGARRRERVFPLYVAANYALAFIVIGLFVLMVVGSLLY